MCREMKDSGIEWIGEIPQHWDIKKHKYVMFKRKELCSKYNGEDILSLTMKGVIVRDLENPSGKMPTTFDGYQKVYENNLLLCLFDIDVTPRCVGLIKNDGLTSPAYSQFIMKNNNNPQYYNYLLTSIDDKKCFVHLSKNLRSSLTEDDFGGLVTVEPPLEEQRNIVKYLDKKVFQIDDIISKQKTLIEKYKAYKQSLITETVIKGLNKNVPMKDSGIEWIGEIPRHWNVLKIKNILENKSVKNNKGEQVLSLYRDYGVVPKDSRNDNHNVTSEDTSGYKLVDIGDFVINKMKAWQGSMSISKYKGIISPAYYICNFKNSSINKEYFNYLIRNQIYLPEFRRLSTGMRIGQWDLSFDDFKQLPYLDIPRDEEKEIVYYLNKKCNEIDLAIDKKEQLIEKLESYKKSLIYECVTGKREVN